jgi:Mg2+ and Co2+ transporter CorA
MRLSEISALVRKSDIDGNLEKWQENFRMLRRDFALFTNLYQFPLLSNQQQAVEMYSLARKQMDVDSLFEEIEKEIQSSHDYISAVQDQQQAVRMERLTVVATVGLIVALSFGFWSMSIVGKQITEHDWFKKIDEWYLLAGTAITISLLFGGVIKYSGKLASIIRWLSDWGSRRK